MATEILMEGKFLLKRVENMGTRSSAKNIESSVLSSACPHLAKCVGSGVKFRSFPSFTLDEISTKMPNPKIKNVKSQRTSSPKRKKFQRRKGGQSGGNASTNNSQQQWSLYNRFDPFPPRMRCCLEYGNSLILTAPNTGNFGTATVYRLNSIYDPLFSGAGDYPYQYNSVASLYGQYFVRSVYIEITFSDASADGIICTALVQSSNNTLDPAGKSIPFMMACTGACTSVMSNTGEQRVVFKKTFQINQLEGLTKTQFEGNQPNYSAPFGSNPAATPFLRIAVADPNAASQTVFCQIRLRFNIEAYERINTTS